MDYVTPLFSPAHNVYLQSNKEPNNTVSLCCVKCAEVTWTCSPQVNRTQKPNMGAEVLGRQDLGFNLSTTRKKNLRVIHDPRLDPGPGEINIKSINTTGKM